MRKIVRITVVLLVLGVAGAAAAWRLGQKTDLESGLRTAPVKRTDLLAAIGATGTLEPEEVVDVGAQVAGQITAFGKDKQGKPIDYGSEVEEGTVLVRIDDSLYAADVASASAAVQQAQATRTSADANVLQMQARLIQAEQDWNRAQKLGPSEALAPSAYDQYKSAYEVAKANLAAAQAAVEQAKANLAAAEASLVRTRRNLSYCTIISPVKGVIIDRRVNIGQTVVSSLNAPSLFLLAKDLTRIQVWVSVNEADIGNIHPGLPVTFTVDAFPGTVFHGQVSKTRLNATMTQNVVTYTVEVVTDNADGKLLPYLTANVQFITARRENVLAVPNAALHWKPAEQPKVQAPNSKAGGQEMGEGNGRSTKFDARSVAAGDQGGGGGEKTQGTVWVEQDGALEPVRVRVGLTDGTQTEIQSPDLREGMAVVIGEQTPRSFAAGSAPGASPFAPQLSRMRGNSASGGGGQGAR